ncbi:MAG: outer membrane beta-barrel domain-containing protein [Gammaproteobacteria bacterium]
METGIRILLLSAVLALSGALSGCASLRNWLDRDTPKEETQDEAAQAESDDATDLPPRVVEPEVARRKIKVPKIDTENVELGGVFGALSVEDFGTNPVYGAIAAYHVSEDFFFQAEYGRTTAGKTSFETLGGNVQLLTGDERQFTYYNLALGYNFLPGEVFLGRGRAMTSSFYLLAGIGSVDFAGDQKFAVSFGGGYRVLPTDWLAIHVRMQDRVFDSDLLGESKLTNNLEANIGLTVFF